MQKTILLLSDSPEYCDTLAQLTRGYRLKKIQMVADRILVDSSTLLDAFLVIVCEDCANQLAHFNSNDLPACIPLLFIGKSASLPRLMTAAGPRLIDYLVLPASKEIMQAKLSFLRQLFTMCYDREIQTMSHHSFLDNIIKRDGLTGLFNRAHLNKKLAEELESARNNTSELVLLILDIDYFTTINKSCGQGFGDSVLNQMAARITKSAHPKDVSFRFSGSNFAIIIPGESLESAAIRAEKIRQTITKSPFRHGSVKREITLSIGIASFLAHTPSSEDEFITMAETALFRAKAEGRNRVVLFSHIEGDDDFSSSRNIESLKMALDRILEKTRSSAIASLQLLAKGLGGPEYGNHTQRVTRLLKLLGARLGLSDSIIRLFENTSIIMTCLRFLLHNDIISKPGEFTSKERKILRGIPFKAAEITEIFDFFSNERTILLTQGEKFDGSGFPEGLLGDEIPLGARLFNLVDSFTAMTSERPYRGIMNSKAIVFELVDQAGKQFDPALVSLLIDIIEEHGLLDLEDGQFSEARHLLEKQSR